MKDLIVNELSLDGQYENYGEFECVLRESCKLFELQNKLSLDILFSSLIYNRKINNELTVYNYLSTSRSDEARKFKIFLSQNYWDATPSQEINVEYFFNHMNITGYSIAEACERKSKLFSFNHTTYSSIYLEVYKKSESFQVENYTNIKDYVNNNFEKILNILWIKLNDNFEIYFKLLLNVFAIKENLLFINNYEFTNKFKEQLLNFPSNLKNKSIEQIAKRLSLTRDKANISESLNDEPIKGLPRSLNMRRFYITKSFGRVNYEQKENCINLKELNTQHDDGLS